MKILVTGSTGHLGEALIKTLSSSSSTSNVVLGVDLLSSSTTTHVGSISDRSFVHSIFEEHPDLEAVIHTATLHKPHIVTHTRQQFVDTNITGTLNLLEESVASSSVTTFIFTSTTSLFGDALKPTEVGVSPSVWITEDVVPIPKNIYGVTKIAAENLCHLMRRLHHGRDGREFNVLILRTSRFFPEEDDDSEKRALWPNDTNLKCNELLYRRVDIADVVSSHVLALEKAASIGFGTYVITATTPFQPEDCATLGKTGEVAAVIEKYFGNDGRVQRLYAKHNWNLPVVLDRIYSNAKARKELGWEPKYTFGYWLDCLEESDDPKVAWSPMAIESMKKKYNFTNAGAQAFDPNEIGDDPYPVAK